MPVEQRTQLVDLCTIIRLAVGAASVSIARVDGNELLYEAAEGAGAHNVIGLRLPSNSGIAGYVAHTGQSLVVDEVQADPRFARDVAERVGYVPTSILAVPVADENDQVVGVVSVLDRTVGVGDPLAVTSASRARRGAAARTLRDARAARSAPGARRGRRCRARRDDPRASAPPPRRRPPAGRCRDRDVRCADGRDPSAPARDAARRSDASFASRST